MPTASESARVTARGQLKVAAAHIRHVECSQLHMLLILLSMCCMSCVHAHLRHAASDVLRHNAVLSGTHGDARQAAENARRWALAASSNITGCPRPMDIIFVVDSSGSINSTEWSILLTFIADFAAPFPWGDGGADMALVEFASSARVGIPFGQYQSGPLFAAGVLAYRRRYNDGTDTWDGLTTAQAHFDSVGRDPTTTGVVRIIVLLTDGESGDTPRTIAAADAAREDGIGVSCISIGLPANATEINGIVGGDSSLLLAVESWANVDKIDATNLLISRLCTVPSVGNVTNTTIATQLPCNTTQNFRYDGVLQPVTITANISVGDLLLCFSYQDALPLPPAVLPPGVTPSNATVCTDFLRGERQIATATAFPAGQPGVPATLWVSVTALPVQGTGACGGNFTLAASYCYTDVAWNASVVGTRTQDVDPNTPLNVTFVGDVRGPMCSTCPAGMAFLGTTGPLAVLCAPICLGSQQFAGLVQGVPRCVDCDPACGACVPPGTPRSCASCPATAPALLINSNDPAFSSPYWNSIDAVVAPSLGAGATSVRGDAALRALVAPSNSSSAGRCVSGCPLGTGGGRLGATCSSTLDTWGNTTRVALATFCLPTGGFSRSPCASFPTSGSNIGMSNRLAAALGIPVSSVLLRSCVDVPSASRLVYAYGAGLSPTNTVQLDGARLNVSLAFRAGSCQCAAVATYALDAGVASVNLTANALWLAYSMVTLVTDPTALQAQATALQAALLSGTTAVPSGYATSCSPADNGAVPVLLDACIDAFAPADPLTNSSQWLERDPLTMCIGKPSAPTPSPTPSVSPAPSESQSVLPPESPIITPLVTVSPSPSGAGSGDGNSAAAVPTLGPGGAAGVSVLVVLVALVGAVAAVWFYRQRAVAAADAKNRSQLAVAYAAQDVVNPLSAPTIIAPQNTVSHDTPLTGRSTKKVDFGRSASRFASAPGGADVVGGEPAQPAQPLPRPDIADSRADRVRALSTRHVE